MALDLAVLPAVECLLVKTLTVNEAAARLNLHRETVLRWTRRGWLKAHRLPNGRLLIQADDIARLLGQEAGHA